jgi:hypothetical protein
VFAKNGRTGRTGISVEESRFRHFGSDRTAPDTRRGWHTSETKGQ